MKKSLFGRTMVITGAGSGLGAALAQEAAASGVHLALLDINNENLLKVKDELTRKYSIRTSTHVIDVSIESSWPDIIQKILDFHGSIDILINNAGISLSPKLFQAIEAPLFDRVLAINLSGALYSIRYCLPHIIKSNIGGIINISSLGGLLGLYGYSPYSMSKFALRGLGESLQMEFAGSPLHCLNIFPGGIKTNIMRNAADLDTEKSEKAHNQFQKIASLTPEKAAKRIVKAFKYKRYSLIMGADARFVLILHRLLGKRSLKLLKTVFTYQADMIDKLQ
jgi:short-subunit dehydrogenase